MFNFLNLSFFASFLYFLAALFAVFYIPGSVILSNLKLRSFHKFVLGTLVGMVFWGWQGYVFGYLNLRFFSYIYILFFVFLYVKQNKHDLIKFRKINLIKKLKLLRFLFGIK